MTVSAQLRALQRSMGGRPRHPLRAPALPGTRWVSIARACYGVVLLSVPGPLITGVIGGPVSARIRAVARVLGARQLAQGTISCLAPTSGLIRAGAAADGIHAASMLALAGTEPGLRRALLAETAIAAAFGSAATAALCRITGATGDADRRR
jgi:hypothetical protein